MCDCTSRHFSIYWCKGICPKSHIQTQNTSHTVRRGKKTIPPSSDNPSDSCILFITSWFLPLNTWKGRSRVRKENIHLYIHFIKQDIVPSQVPPEATSLADDGNMHCSLASLYPWRHKMSFCLHVMESTASTYAQQSFIWTVQIHWELAAQFIWLCKQFYLQLAKSKSFWRKCCFSCFFGWWHYIIQLSTSHVK